MHRLFIIEHHGFRDGAQGRLMNPFSWALAAVHGNQSACALATTQKCSWATTAWIFVAMANKRV